MTKNRRRFMYRVACPCGAGGEIPGFAADRWNDLVGEDDEKTVGPGDEYDEPIASMCRSCKRVFVNEYDDIADAVTGDIPITAGWH